MKLRFSITKTLVVLMAFCYSFQWVHAQEIGLELYSLREKFKTDVPGALATIKSWGIHEIEGGGTYGLPMDEYKKLLAQNDIRMVSVGADFNALAKNPQTAIDEAKAFGAKYIMCSWIPHNGDEFSIEDIKKAIDVFNTAGKQIHDAGLSLCYHPHGYEFRPYEGGTLFDYLAQHTDPKYVNFEMDVFWVKHPGQDPVALMQKYPNRFVLMHLKDRKPGTEGNQNGRAPEETNVVLGQGDVNIAAVMKEAKKIGIKHYFIEDESLIPEQQIPQSLAYLHQLK
jgi:sugar phosphate isomerase/epimerase